MRARPQPMPSSDPGTALAGGGTGLRAWAPPCTLGSCSSQSWTVATNGARHAAIWPVPPPASAVLRFQTDAGVCPKDGIPVVSAHVAPRGSIHADRPFETVQAALLCGCLQENSPHPHGVCAGRLWKNPYSRLSNPETRFRSFMALVDHPCLPSLCQGIKTAYRPPPGPAAGFCRPESWAVLPGTRLPSVPCRPSIPGDSVPAPGRLSGSCRVG